MPYGDDRDMCGEGGVRQEYQLARSGKQTGRNRFPCAGPILSGKKDGAVVLKSRDVEHQDVDGDEDAGPA